MPFKEMLRTVGRLLKYIKPYWKIVLCALLLTAFVTAARMCQAKFVGLIMELMSADKFNYKDGHTPFNDLNTICLSFLGVMLLMGIGTYFQKFTTDQGGLLAARDFRGEVFAKLQRLPMGYFDNMRDGEILSRCTNDIAAASCIYTTLADFVKNTLMVVGCLSFMFYRDWMMTLVILLTSPMVAIAISNFGKRMGQKTAKLQARLADLASLQFENISAIKAVKAYTLENFEIERFRCRNEDNYAAQLKVTQVTATQSPTVEFIGIIGIMVIVWFGATRILQEQVTFAQMTEYWTLMVMTSQPISALSNFYSTCQNAANAGKRTFEMIDSIPESSPEEKNVLSNIKGKIEFRNVIFGYNKDKNILNGINITIKPGEVIAIVGANGAGKTTMVNMVPRFYKPSEGSVLIDDIDIATADLASLRGCIGMVIQESVLFRGNIKENIRMGKLDATDEEIMKAAEISNTTEFAAKMPDGFNTEVGERGGRLSGGQRQRVAIARALIRDPRILILDEFTSGIDAESENFITDAIDKAMKGRTCLVIAHRLNTIRHADRIIVLDGGQIAEEGTHEELYNKGGLYKKLYEAQAVKH